MRLMRSGKIAHDGDPVLAWMIGNVVGHYDAKENVYPAQGAARKQDRRRHRSHHGARPAHGATDLLRGSINCVTAPTYVRAHKRASLLNAPLPGVSSVSNLLARAQKLEFPGQKTLKSPPVA